MPNAPVFEETYQQYLAEIGSIDYLAKAELLGAERSGDSLNLTLYDHRYSVSADGITDCNGEVYISPAVRVILSKYVLQCEQFEPRADDPFKTFRDFRNASPLLSYFTTNTNKTLEASFSGKIEQLQEVSRDIGGVEQEADCYDCSILFYVLPRIPVVLNFNDRDDLFPASCSVLFRASAEMFLDMECLAMTGTLLAGKLIRS